MLCLIAWQPDFSQPVAREEGSPSWSGLGDSWLHTPASGTRLTCSVVSGWVQAGGLSLLCNHGVEQCQLPKGTWATRARPPLGSWVYELCSLGELTEPPWLGLFIFKWRTQDHTKNNPLLGLTTDFKHIIPSHLPISPLDNKTIVQSRIYFPKVI